MTDGLAGLRPAKGQVPRPPDLCGASMNYQQEIAKRRSFAIISHPDAGKTTLTEKFLLFGGAHSGGRCRKE
ncbi:MAG: hypothetical protein ACKOD1_06685 [Sphingomonadales bacterium]